MSKLLVQNIPEHTHSGTQGHRQSKPSSATKQHLNGPGEISHRQLRSRWNGRSVPVADCALHRRKGNREFRATKSAPLHGDTCIRGAQERTGLVKLKAHNWQRLVKLKILTEIKNSYSGMSFILVCVYSAA